MSKRVQIIRHVTGAANQFIGKAGEVTMDLTTNELRTHDGATPGGHRIITKEQADLIYQFVGLADFSSIKTDIVNEHTGNAGVTVDGVLIKDNLVDGVDVSTLPGLISAAGGGAGAVAADLAAHEADTTNPHLVDKTDIGLSAVTNNAQLKIASNLGDVASVATSRTNLGLAALALKATIDSSALIASSVVTYAKIQNVAAQRLLGNPTGSPAAPSEVSLVAGDLVFSGTTLALASLSKIQFALFQDQKSTGTDGGSTVATTWTKRICDDAVANNITGLSQASSVFTFGTTGTYIIYAIAPFHNGQNSRIRIRRTNGTPATFAGGTAADNGNSNLESHSVVMFAGNITAGDTIELQYWAPSVIATLGLGEAVGNDEAEVYAQMLIIRIT